MKKIYTIMFLTALNLFSAAVIHAETHPLQVQISSLSAGAIHGPGSICAGEAGVSYSVDTVPGAVTYHWTVPAGATVVTGQGTHSMTMNFGSVTGNICVTADDGSGPGIPSCMTAYLAATRPSAPDTITGPLNTVCPGQNITYSVSEDTLTETYNWILPSRMTIVSGAGTSMIQVHVDTGFVWGYLRASRANCRGTSAQYVIAVYSAPTKPGSVTGPSVGACANGTYTYSFAPVPGATSYTWYAPAGCVIASPASSGNPLTTSVTSVDITFPSGFINGVLSISSNSGCNSSELRSFNIRSLPLKPGAIHGPFYGVCNSSNVLYTVDSVAGATSYTWGFYPSDLVTLSGNGNDSVIVSFLPGYDHATICVTANDACGSSVARCGVVYARPQVPGLISGPTGACNSIPAVSIAYYEIDTIHGTGNYLWTVPPGATITAGQGTTQITVDYMGASTGNVTVTAQNACGNSPARTLHIIVNPCRVSGTGEVITMPEITAFPNPATDQFTFSFESTGVEQYNIRLMDITGREVDSRLHFSTTGTNAEIFDVASLPRGIYLLELTRNGSKEYLKVVVK